MSDFTQPRSFRSPPETITVGEPGRPVIIRDLKYGKRKELQKYLMGLWFDRETLPTATKLFGNQVAGMISTGKMDVTEAITKIRGDLLKAYESGEEADHVAGLLGFCTDGQVTPEILAEMGGGEAIQLLVWLLDRHLQTEKNLDASLNSILNPTAGQSST